MLKTAKDLDLELYTDLSISFAKYRITVFRIKGKQAYESLVKQQKRLLRKLKKRLKLKLKV